MACIDQYQFCNPNNQRCTDLTSSATALHLARTIGMNPTQQFIMARYHIHLQDASLSETLAGRGGSALRATEIAHDSISDPLPDDQWMIEVDAWFKTGLAKLQKFMVDYAAGPQNVIHGTTIQKFNDSIGQSMCRNQKIHSTGNTTNFSVLGLALVLIVCSALILINLVLARLVEFIQRKFKIGGIRRLQWITDGDLQLQRMAFEEAGMGTWSGGAAAVPVTRFGEKFGLPRDTDPNHPRLVQDAQGGQGGQGGVGGGGGGWSDGGGGGDVEMARLIRHKTSTTEDTMSPREGFGSGGVSAAPWVG